MHYDLAIIGSGSGNSILGPEWEDKKVAMIEKGTFGGTCLNVGCIPTKMLVYPSELAALPAEASKLGVDLRTEAVHWRQIRDRIFGRIDEISESGLRYRAEEQDNVDVVQQTVRFTDAHTLEAEDGTVIEADQIVIASGSRPVMLDIEGIDLPQVHTSDTVMRIDELPRRMVVIGGGYIAAEFAGIFHGLGVEVSQLVRGEALLSKLDETITERFSKLASEQWDVRFGTQAGAIKTADDGVVLDLLDKDGNDAGTLETDLVLVAVGRKPNSDLLDPQAAGFDQHDDGRIAVDQYQRVLSDGEPVRGVWALGDISSPDQLKHVANHEARVVAHNLLVATGASEEHLQASDHRFVPSAVFSSPQLADVGMTEEEAREHCERAGQDLAVVIQDYGSTAYGWAMEDKVGFVKLLAERESGKLLGAHLLGHEASILIQPLIQAMHFDLPAKKMARGQYWIHPALAEVVENALLGLDTKR